jgi:hypothetical protein
MAIDIQVAQRFDEIRNDLLEMFKTLTGARESYHQILRHTLSLMYPDREYSEPDWEKIHVIDDGDYQGTLLFLIPEQTYQPSTYWVTMVSYGSCSGCDTLGAIRDCVPYDQREQVNDEQANDYATLALHMVQKMKKISYHDFSDFSD